jgi:hypothetical protein
MIVTSTARRSLAAAILLLLSCCGNASEPEPLDALEDRAAAPALLLDSPLPGSWHTATQVLVAGRVVPPLPGTLSVNGDEGRPVGAEFSLWVELPEGPQELALTFRTDGGEEAAVTLSLVVDSLPPWLAVLTPDHGLLPPGTEGALVLTLEAEDENGIDAPAAVTDLVSGVTSESPFASPLDVVLALVPGAHILQAAVTDAAGHRATEHRALFAGPLEPCEPHAEAPDLAWDVGNTPLATAGAVAAGLVEETDFSPTLAELNPVYQADEIRVNLHGLTLSGLHLEPRVENGQLRTGATLDRLDVAGTLTLSAEGKPYTIDGAIEGLALEFWLSVAVVEGDLALHVDDLEVDADKVLLAVTDSAGKEIVAPTSVQGAFLDFVTETLAEALLDWSTDSLQEISDYLAGELSFSLLDIPISASYRVVGADILQERLRLSFQADFELPDGQPPTPWPGGCPRRTHAPPPASYEDAFAVTLWFSYDFVNRVLLEVWQTGLLRWEVDQAFVDDLKLEIDLVCGLMGDTLRDAAGGVPPEAPMTLTADLLLPPEFQPLPAGPGESPMPGLVATGVRLVHRHHESGAAEPFFTAIISLASALHAKVLHNALYLAPELPAFALDIAEIPGQDAAASKAVRRRVEREVESHFEALVPDAVGAAAAALLSIPLPATYGINVIEGELGSEPSGGYMRLSGNVEMGGTP